jgi:RHS repeat-associated protein
MSPVRASIAVTDTLLADAWGVQVATTGETANPFAAFGQWSYVRDTPTRLYVGARHLRVDLARWLSRDPIGYDGGDWNPYAYSANQPTSLPDPSGLDPRFDATCDRTPGSKNAVSLVCQCISHLTKRDLRLINLCVQVMETRHGYNDCARLDVRTSRHTSCLRDTCQCTPIVCLWKDTKHPACGKCHDGWGTAQQCGVTTIGGRNPCQNVVHLCLPQAQTSRCNCMAFGSPTAGVWLHEIQHSCLIEHHHSGDYACMEFISACIYDLCVGKHHGLPPRSGPENPRACRE